MNPFEQNFYQIVDTAVQQQVSDIHLAAGRYPIVRLDGRLQAIAQDQVLNDQNMRDIAGIMLSEEEVALLDKERELDFSYQYHNNVRFRVNVFYQYGSIAVAMRFIPSQILTLEDLHLPDVISQFTDYRQGLVLVTGPTGSGKTTTLSSLVEMINQKRSDHIVVLEDPIERIFISKKSIIDQREIGSDTLTLDSAFKSLFRQDADIVVIGDLRDMETMALSMNIAETGHLVFVALHTNSAAQTVERIINAFPHERQNQVRSQLALTLVGVVSQRLVPALHGGRVPAVEVLFANAAVRNLIHSDKTQDIDMVIETGAGQGMVSMNKALVNLVEDGSISVDVAKTYSLRDTDISKYFTEG